jgi:uncharacterized membrane protein YjjP (DUF1212 family)
MFEENKPDINEVGTLLLEIGTHLMSNGSSANRVRVTIDRIADAYDYNADLLITNRALMLTVTSNDNSEYYSRVKRTSPHGVNYKLVSGISRMSWRIIDEKWSIAQIRTELDRLLALPHYPRLLILSLVALAGASFCRLFGGDIIEMGTTFVATFIGLYVRQQAQKLNFNVYLCWLFAAITASLISGLGLKVGYSDTLEHAFASSVLFLIPGVPLINTFTDIIDGNILNGMVRFTNAMVMIFMIALGMLSAMLIYNF